nr:hypothetical protein [Nanoarchaeum sp.]
MEQKEKELKSKLRLDINRSLLAVCFTVFALIISINPSLFKQSFLVPIQLTLAIPLLLSSMFARSKLAYTTRPKLWDKYGFFTFLVGYSFLINVLGILLSISIGLKFGLTFLIFNMTMSLIYSTFEIIEHKSKLVSRIKKDLLFIILLLLGGILPSLGFY